MLEVPDRSFFLFGPRGVGKTTWARSTFPDALHIDLLDETLFVDLLANPALFRELISERQKDQWVVVDEVQRVPGLLNEVHRHIELRGVRFALLGSSARKLKTAGTNLLAGRALYLEMFPLTAAELGNHFDLEEALRYGTIPLVWSAKDRRQVLQSYTHLYLREEIRAEAMVRNLSGFVRFLPVAALMHAQTLNAASLARDARVARSTVVGYLEILEDTLLVSRLQAFEAKLRVRERRRPKLYWVDPGLVRAVKRQFGPVSLEERGALMEGWVYVVLRAHNYRGTVFDDIAYWSPVQSKTEVDFLLTRGDARLAIEVKSTARYSSTLLRGLRAVNDLPNVARRILVFNGDRVFQTEDGIHIWPLNHFHEALSEGRLWD